MIKIQVFSEMLLTDKNANVLITKVMEHELPEQVDPSALSKMKVMSETLQ
jgi:hypothetical protein